jgi:hypothetical protein
MKKIFIIFSFFALITSCGKLEDLNKNTKDPAAVPGETLFTGAQRQLSNLITSTNVNRNNFRLFVQYWTETTYTDESNYDLTTRTTPDNWWDILYINCLKNFNEAKNILQAAGDVPGDDPAVLKNKLAIIDINMVYCYDVLVTTFGNIPYTQALDINTPLPVYDDAVTVYNDLLTRLDADIAQLDPAFNGIGGDNLFGGDVALWLKFANSLKLRMGMLIADSDAAKSKSVVESAVAAGVISSNDENAKLVYLGAPPNQNPVFVDLVSSGRHDFVVANTIVDSMNSLNDPRRPFYFTVSPNGIYEGGEYGNSNDYLAFSHTEQDSIQDPTFPADLFDYAEVQFLLAEAVERGYAVGGTAEEHYNAAITASIEDWGGTAAQATAYIANPRVNYATAEGDWKQKIGMQSWIAYYNRGFEAWTQWRRLDYPLLVEPPDALSTLPIRYTFPIEEQTLNPDNYAAASAAIGGDAVDTPLWWDKFQPE